MWSPALGRSMRRREFIALLGGAAAARPLTARAQQESRPPLVAVLSPLSSDAAALNIEALRTGFRDLGYIEGRNFALEVRYGNGVPALMAEEATELVSLRPAVILTGSEAGILAVHSATSTIPIIMTGVIQDPVALGLVKSIVRPAGNITGTWMYGDGSLFGKRLELLHDAVPGITHIGVMVNPGDPTDDIALKLLPSSAQKLGLVLRFIEVREAADLDTAFSAASRAGAQALFVSQSPLFNSHRAEVAAAAVKERLPAVYGFRQFAEAGGLMSYGTSLPEVYRRSAALVDKVLNGTNPADLPIEIPTRYELVLNQKAARAIGLTFPPIVLARADEVIE